MLWKAEALFLILLVGCSSIPRVPRVERTGQGKTIVHVPRAVDLPKAMPKRFFELTDDVNVPNRWHLDSPVDSRGEQMDEGLFRRGGPVHITVPLRIPVELAGKPLDFSFAAVGLPVVHVRIASMFAELAPDDVQLIPVNVGDQPAQYLILVATRLIRCIDEKASRIRLWTHEDGAPPRVGHYASVRDMRIDKAKAGSANVFRCEGWIGPLIVSGELKDGLDHLSATGTRFEEV